MAAEDNRKSIVTRVEPELHQEIKIRAINQGCTVQEYVLGLITADLKKDGEAR